MDFMQIKNIPFLLLPKVGSSTQMNAKKLSRKFILNTKRMGWRINIIQDMLFINLAKQRKNKKEII
jgi:hypothetical protein